MATGGYGNILAGNSSDLYTDLFRLALAYGMNRMGGGSGDTPNFYNVPLTPEQKRVEDEKWRVYQAGGSDAQKAARGLATQFLSQQQGAPPSFSFMSPEMKGQTFAGGIRVPTFDFSKINPAPTGTQSPIPPGPGTSPIRAGTSNITGTREGILHQKLPTETGYDNGMGRTPVESTWNGAGRPTMDPLEMGRDDPNLWFNGGNMNHADASALFSGATGWFQNFKKEHPNWAQLGPRVLESALAAAFGLPGAVAGRLLRSLIMRDSNPGAPPPAGGGGQNAGTIPLGGTPGGIQRP